MNILYIEMKVLHMKNKLKAAYFSPAIQVDFT